LEGVKRGEGEGMEAAGRQGGVEDLREGDEGDGVHGPVGGEGGVSREVVERLKAEVAAWPEELRRREIVVVEGFLLFGESVREKAEEVFDVRILLRATREAAQGRRGRRNGYVTLEGFWTDPEGYFGGVVWRGYVGEHEWIFEGGDVEGEGKGGTGVWVGGLGEGVEGVVGWVLGVVRGEVGRLVGEGM